MADFVDNDESMSEDDEEETLRYYFNRGFRYDEILLFLYKYHDITFSYRTLLRRFDCYGLRRRNNIGPRINQHSHEDVRERVRSLIDGPASAGGYRSVWHYLELNGMRVWH